MKLSTGKAAFPVEFENGDKAVIYFNPNDRRIQERIRAFETSVEKKIKEIDVEKYTSRLDGEQKFVVDVEHPEKLLEMSSEDLKALQDGMVVINELEEEYNKAVREELDVVFASKVSDVVFRYCQPFDVVVVEEESGEEKREFYVMHFIRWLMVELKKYGVENKSAVDKHIAKYAK